MASSDLVVLTGGVSVLRVALILALDLEQRGFRLSVRPDGRLEVQPSVQLTPEDMKLIREHRDELIRIVRYEADDSHLRTLEVQ